MISYENIPLQSKGDNWMKKQPPLTTYDAVKEKALRLLEFRSHSEEELRQKLRRQGASEEHIEETLEFCRKYGFVNDEQYALAKAKDLMNLKKFGPRRIRSELKAKGISPELIEIAMEELDTDAGTSELKRLVSRKLSGDFSPKSLNRCIRYFLYRGYELRDIRSCIEETVAMELSD